MADGGGVVGVGMGWGRGVDLRGRVWYHVKVLQFRPTHTLFAGTANLSSRFRTNGHARCFVEVGRRGVSHLGETATA